MGMFDYVNFSCACPQCGTVNDSFQSKDLGCDMEKVEPDGLEYFYTSCHQCKSWIQFMRPMRPNPPIRETPLTLAQVLELGFVQTCEPSDGPDGGVK